MTGGLAASTGRGGAPKRALGGSRLGPARGRSSCFSRRRSDRCSAVTKSTVALIMGDYDETYAFLPAVHRGETEGRPAGLESLWVTFPAACGVSPGHAQRLRQEERPRLPEASREPPIGSLLKSPAACGGDPLFVDAPQPLCQDRRHLGAGKLQS